MAVGFDDIQALESVWKLHSTEKMNGLIQDLLINQALLKKLQATRIVLTTRMFEDEYTNCKNELLSRSMQRISIKTKRMIYQSIGNYIDLLILSTKISCDNFVLMPSYTFRKDFIVETKKGISINF